MIKFAINKVIYDVKKYDLLKMGLFCDVTKIVCDVTHYCLDFAYEVLGNEWTSHCDAIKKCNVNDVMAKRWLPSV